MLFKGAESMSTLRSAARGTHMSDSDATGREKAPDALTTADAGAPSAGPTDPAPRQSRSLAGRIVIWAITLGCFYLLYTRIDAAAARQGQELLPYLAGVFARVNWLALIALLIPYSCVFFLLDSVAVWRTVNWFNARVRYRDILPVRASTYILSIMNEQVGKGAMALYLQRREGVPGWKLGSSMLFLMFCEFYYLLGWATLGWWLNGHALPEVFDAIPLIAIGAVAFFAVFYAYFRGAIRPASKLRDRQLLHAFREARLIQYLTILVIKSPALLTAVLVYDVALGLFGVDLSLTQMLGYLPVIFFGAGVPGPMRAVAITLWVVLLPDHAGEMAAFALVMHNFFILFNAAIGLVFLRRTQRELFGGPART
jgi:hypothetical protein